MTFESHSKAMEEFQRLRERIRETDQKQYRRKGDETGDFSYGVPRVLDWGGRSEAHHRKVLFYCRLPS